MADRFWVGGGSANTVAATGPTNWATTSGGANNASVPGTGDVAKFDLNSGSGNAVIGANITWQGLDCNGYAGTLTHNSGVTLTINTGSSTSLRFSSGMTYTPAATNAIIALTHTTGTANITSNGKRLAALTINGAGGTTALLDALLVNALANSTLTLTTGIFDANGFALTAIIVSSSNANTRSLILGSAVTIGGNVTSGTTIWSLTTVTNLTFTKNSANIEVLAPTSSIQGVGFSGGGLTYNDLTLDSSSNQTVLQMSGANTFAHFINSGGWDIFIGTGITVSNPFTWTGTQANPILVYSQTIGAVAISCPSGACTLTWGGLAGITGSGGATFTATNTFNFGTNSGWSISPPADASVSPPTAAQIAAAVWRDTTAGDFTVAASVGKSIMNGVALGTGLTVNDITTKTGFSLSAAGVQAIWDALTSALSTVGSIGKLIVDNLNAAITTRSSHTAADVWAVATRVLTAGTNIQLPSNGLANISAWTVALTGNITGNLSGSVGSVTTVSDKTGYALTAAYDAAKTAAQVGSAMTLSGDFSATMKTSLNAATPVVTVSDKTGFSLTSGERTAIANEVEAQIIDETDSEKVLTAITDKIASVNPSLGSLTVAAITSSVWSAGTRVLTANTNLNDPTAAAVASAVRTELTTELGRIDVAGSSRLASGSYTAPDNATITAINAKIGTPTGASVSADIAAVKAVDDAIKTVTDGLPTFVHTGGKLWVLDGDGNGVASASQTQAIQDKTDHLTFTVPDELDVNLQSINDVALTGAGVEDTDEWRPA